MGGKKCFLILLMFLLFNQITYAVKLVPYLINPVADINETQNEFFNFTAGVRCVGGDCGNITATLDPAAIYCTKSPCIASSDLIKSKDNVDVPEPNASNTIDGCIDGYFGKYFDSVSVENVTITDIGGNYFKRGDIIQVNIIVYCKSQGGAINLVYTNKTNSSPEWQMRTYDMCPHSHLIYTMSRNLTLDNIAGNHTIRGMIQLFEWGTCGDGIYDDQDDVTIYVQGDKGVIPMHSGTPFYTINQNPVYPNNLSCLQDMKDGDECNITWTVNATGNIGEEYEFFAIFESDNTEINKSETEKVNIRIVEKQQEPKENLTKFNIALTEGWNLISFPLNLTNKSINNVFKNINLKSIFSYGSWFYYFNETDNNFNTINEANGYWVNSLQNQNLEIKGKEFNRMGIDLKQGWNLIGYPSLNSSLINKTLKNLNYSVVYSYNNSKWLSYVPNRTVNSLETLKPGYGYWININKDALLVFNGD